MTRRRWRWSVAIATSAIAAIAVAPAIVRADLENQQRGGEGGVFTSKPDRISLVVPRGWHATDQASYPGLLLWMAHGQPDAHIVLTAEPFTHALYCSWDASCRNSHDALPSKLACALSAKLKKQGMRVGAIQAGPKENEAAGIPSVWIEYDDDKKGHFLRQAVTLTEDRVITLLLSTGSLDARAGYVRAFEQTLRTLRPLSAEEVQTAAAEAGSQAPAVPGDAGIAPTTLPDAAVAPAAPPTTFPSAPAAKQSAVGPCP